MRIRILTMAGGAVLVFGVGLFYATSLAKEPLHVVPAAATTTDPYAELQALYEACELVDDIHKAIYLDRQGDVLALTQDLLVLSYGTPIEADATNVAAAFENPDLRVDWDLYLSNIVGVCNPSMWGDEPLDRYGHVM